GVKDFQIRELTPSNNLQILLGMGLENSGKPFYQLPILTDKKDVTFSYENNPRILWLVNSLQKAGVSLTPRSISQVDSTWTSMSGQMSDSMRNNALIGILIALTCIFIYIAFRFEYKYATSSIVCLLHDVFICLGSIAILNYFRVPIQIDLHSVAAIMTIIGYSLNDTIIVFDRIREELKNMRKASFADVVNYALNVTLSRTMMTSGTTLTMLLCLVFFGGSTIFSFSLVMAIGVVFGTLSSLFIATPCLVWLHNLEVKKEGDLQESSVK
ncbi:MAG: protein translocase subunit SecF, partial [Chlamydiota bacterium]